MNKEFTQNGITLVFYQKPYDKNYSFLIKDNPSLTEEILSTVKTKKVSEKDIYYCKKAIFDLIESNKLNQQIKPDKDYISLVKEELDCFKSNNIQFDLTELPVEVNQRINEVTFTIIFNGVTIAKTASNKKIAKQLCYKELLEKNLIG